MAIVDEIEVVVDTDFVRAGVGERYSTVGFEEIEGLDVVEQGAGISEEESSTVLYVGSLRFHGCYTWYAGNMR